MRKLLSLCATVVLIIPSQVAIANTLTVGLTGGYDYSNIQSAINGAAAGDTVLVYPGTYTGSGNRGIDFGGKNITLRSNAGAGSTIIDCQNASRGFYFHSYESENSRLDGFTIKNGHANDYGGAVYCVGGSRPTLTNCLFTNNSATEGGAIRTIGTGANATITNCTFVSNTASNGGAIENHNGSLPTITNCIFSGNVATNDGGAIRNWNSYLSIIYSTFSGNSASRGGGIYNWYSSPQYVTDCILWGNSDSGGTDESAQIDNTNSPGGMSQVVYSCIQGLEQSGSGNIGRDPLFRGTNDYWLLPNSPCIDAGIDARVYSDILGSIRPYDFPGVDNNGSLPEFDMGAYEVPEPATLLLLGLGGLMLRKRRV